MVISLSIAVGLKYVNSARDSLLVESNVLEANMVLEDVLKILKKLPQFEDVNSTDDLGLLLQMTSNIPLDNEIADIIIHFSSAANRVNPDIFKNQIAMENFKIFLQKRMVNITYADMIFDSINVLKEDNSYRTDIFDEHPFLYRGSIASYEQLDTLHDIYKQKFHENSIDSIDSRELFKITQDANTTLDANYISSEVWQLILGCDETRANELLSDGFLYADEKTLYDSMSDEEKPFLNIFNVHVNQTIIFVVIEINTHTKKSYIKFEYNIKNRKGRNFVFEI